MWNNLVVNQWFTPIIRIIRLDVNLFLGFLVSHSREHCFRLCLAERSQFAVRWLTMAYNSVLSEIKFFSFGFWTDFPSSVDLWFCATKLLALEVEIRLSLRLYAWLTLRDQRQISKNQFGIKCLSLEILSFTDFPRLNHILYDKRKNAFNLKKSCEQIEWTVRGLHLNHAFLKPNFKFTSVIGKGV